MYKNSFLFALVFLSFSSDLEPLKKINGFNKEIDLNALKAFLNSNYITR